nr:hypothetical protein [Tanacetum cinerariifolium]
SFGRRSNSSGPNGSKPSGRGLRSWRSTLIITQVFDVLPFATKPKHLRGIIVEMIGLPPKLPVVVSFTLTYSSWMLRMMEKKRRISSPFTLPPLFPLSRRMIIAFVVTAGWKQTGLILRLRFKTRATTRATIRTTATSFGRRSNSSGPNGSKPSGRGLRSWRSTLIITQVFDVLPFATFLDAKDDGEEKKDFITFHSASTVSFVTEDDYCLRGYCRLEANRLRSTNESDNRLSNGSNNGLRIWHQSFSLDKRRLDVIGASVISRRHCFLCHLRLTFHYFRKKRRGSRNRRSLICSSTLSGDALQILLQSQLAVEESGAGEPKLGNPGLDNLEAGFDHD